LSPLEAEQLPNINSPARRALIVGISGQDGAYLAKLLLEKGYEVVGTSRDAQVARFDGLARLGIRSQVHLESMSPTDFRSAAEILSRWMPDEVYNLAGQSSVALSFAQPVDALNSIMNATVTLMEVIRFLNRPIRFYNAGSSECFGDVAAGVANEETPFRPRSPYAAAKAAAHWMVANYREGYGLFACTGILFNHESPLRPERFVTQKIAVAAAQIAAGRREKLMLGNMGIKRDWGWAPEYVDAMWRMLQQPNPQDLVIATGILSSLEQLVAAAFAAVNLEWRDHVEMDPSLKRPTDLAGFAGDASKAHQILGWKSHLVMPEIARALVEAECDREFAPIPAR
jgi:GDPmannose 4,6-dehydratase